MKACFFVPETATLTLEETCCIRRCISHLRCLPGIGFALGATPAYLVPPELPPAPELYGHVNGCPFESPPFKAERIPVDLRLRKNGSLEPTEEDVRRIEAVGGRVLYLFNVAVVRAEVDVKKLPALIEGPNRVADWAVAVTDLENFDVFVQIFYHRRVGLPAVKAIESLGGRKVWGEQGRKSTFHAVVPNDAIPKIVAFPNVDRVRALAQMCGGMM